MKLKRTPEDFIVDELTDIAVGDGPLALYRLTKQSVTTLDALDTIRRVWRIDRPRLSYGGLKDRHAVTRQHLTIGGGPKRNFDASHFVLEYLGQTTHPFKSEDIRANRFEITLRDLSDAEVKAAEKAAREIAAFGVPNYFDDQRFGSLGKSGKYIAVPWCQGDFESALRLALAESNPHDRPREKKEKECLRTHWGNWARLGDELARSERRSIILHLVDHPGDFEGAFAKIDDDLRGLFRSALQSAMWNRILGAIIREQTSPEERFELRLKSGKAAFHLHLEDAKKSALSTLEVLFPSARAEYTDDADRARAENAARSFGFTLDQMVIKSPKSDFFSKGARAALLFPNEWSQTVAADDLYPKKKKMKVAFELPRGAYATMIVKRLTEVS